MIAKYAEIKKLIKRGAIFYVSTSGGKDSQAMYIILSRLVPGDQIVVVHADLGKVEWRGIQEHIRANTAHKLNVVRANKTFLGMVRHRHATRPDVPCWPSSATRQCTSDLKRDPIHKFIRADMLARGVSLAVNCTGIRAAEGAARRKKIPLSINKRLSKAGREVHEYMPIHHWSKRHVFKMIDTAGQQPFWAYAENDRISCVFCIMGCEGDLKHGARHRPELYQEYLDVEAATGWTMFNGQSLRERVESPAALNT